MGLVGAVTKPSDEVGLVGAVTNPSEDGDAEPVPPFDCASEVLTGGTAGRPVVVGEGGNGRLAGSTGTGGTGRVGTGGRDTGGGGTGRVGTGGLVGTTGAGGWAVGAFG